MNSSRNQPRKNKKASPTVGSQRLLQRAVNLHPAVLRNALIEAGVIAPGDDVEWRSPLAEKHPDTPKGKRYREYRDMMAMRQLRVPEPLRVPLSDFWPSRGPVWDGLGIATGNVQLLVEAKAHLSEAASSGSKATPKSLARIQSSLNAVRAVLAPESTADWSSQYYQYANRLAFQFFLKRMNGVPSKLVFLNFTNATDVGGPDSVQQWIDNTQGIHNTLGLPADLSALGVHHAYVDARRLPAGDRNAGPSSSRT